MVNGQTRTGGTTPRTLADRHPPGEAFRHEALFYAGEDAFLAATVPFIRRALAEDAPVQVVVGAGKIDLLRTVLGEEGRAVSFVDMSELGRNPARIIPAWWEFLEGHSGSGGRPRGVGEPIWAGRSPAELVECQRHEVLLNLAFAGAPPWWLMCPYDTHALAAEVVREAERSHPYLAWDGVGGPSSRYRGIHTVPVRFEDPLPEPSGPAAELPFGVEDLPRLRRFVARQAAEVGLEEGRREDLVLAVHEVAVNSVEHGGGRGRLRIWREGQGLVCELRDRGLVEDPLVGRRRPVPDEEPGWGLWLVNQVCDLVQIRSSAAGTVVRLHVRVGESSGPGTDGGE